VTPAEHSGKSTGKQSSHPRRLQINPEPLKIVDASRREFWERLVDEVEIETAGKFRKRWTLAETVRVVRASPSETYTDVANELDRSPGAIRFRRQAMIHLLRDEHGAMDRVRAYRDDPKANHRYHDYAQIHETLENLGYFDLPVSQQFELAQPLQQPSAAWRGDGTSAVLNDGSTVKKIRDEVRRLLSDVRTAAGGQQD
jgi:hypothetical protein